MYIVQQDSFSTKSDLQLTTMLLKVLLSILTNIFEYYENCLIIAL